MATDHTDMIEERLKAAFNFGGTERERMINPGARVRMGPTGFNAKLIRKTFLNKANAHPVTARDMPTVLNSTKYYAKCQAEDVIMFIKLFLKYGNNIQKALRIINHIGSNIIKQKCALYGIATDSTVTGQGLKHDQLSLSRITLAFPTHTARLIMVKNSPGILLYSTFFNQELPLVMQHTIFPGLIPAKQFTDNLKKIALVLNVEKSVKLSGCKDIGTIRESLGEMIQSSVKYVNAVINNDIEDGQKLKILKEAGILVIKADGEFELAEATVALVNKLEGIKILYSLKYSVAVRKAMRINNNEDVSSLNSDSD